MGILRKRPDDLHRRIRRRIRLVNDSYRSFAARDEQESGADIVGLSDLVLHAVPGAELLQRSFAVFSRPIEPRLFTFIDVRLFASSYILPEIATIISRIAIRSIVSQRRTN